MGLFKTKRLMIFLVLQGYIFTPSISQDIFNFPDPAESFDGIDRNINRIPTDDVGILEAEKWEQLNNILSRSLLIPDSISPIVYFDDYPNNMDQDYGDDGKSLGFDSQINNIPSKRSRYYRKFPWKRQQLRQFRDYPRIYPMDYFCRPSKEEIFRLLIAMHDKNRKNSVNFCNRKRPASVIFNNIRFLNK